jgi:hypothetical protein
MLCVEGLSETTGSLQQLQVALSETTGSPRPRRQGWRPVVCSKAHTDLQNTEKQVRLRVIRAVFDDFWCINLVLVHNGLLLVNP